MSRLTIHRVTAAGALALALAMAGAPPAHAREIAGPGRVWQQLARAWESGLSLLWPWTKAPGAPAGNGLRGVTQKEGPGLDPDGTPKPGSGATGSTTCGSCGEEGPGLDPNG